ncbi:4-(cytidine 5'-diphospho)-2-C-methyl-D-erythritol kinase [Peptoniphilus sp.]|jgi:4-diphosphocytidyl-2-C-methyl-D-erythritol kinase|uniref:4-(cytidine 5'-diphospho)-2-C-methyl-D-erythritol kinase n=1 Tax=Peptoniphilus sp. TaxID=1971214 RepID=UPI003D8FC5A6
MINKRAAAKINLSLDVCKKRDDGYHDIKTLMVMTNLCDDMKFSKSDKVSITPEFDFPMEENFIYKAYLKLKEYIGRDIPFNVQIEKNIPEAAGLAGGTSNGAATFYALNELYKLNLKKEELIELARPMGADFTYMMTGGFALATGIGDKLEALDDIYLKNVLLVNPGIKISTPEVYQKIKIKDERIDFDKVIKSLRDLNIDNLNRYMGNSMEEVVFSMHPEVKEIKHKIIDMNGASLMSGSGSTVFGIFENRSELDEAYSYFKEKYDLSFKTKAGGNYGSF